MNVLNKNINNIFFIFALAHLIIWTLVPSLTNKNLPLDTIEALAWGSNLDWGFTKHPPMSAFFSEVFFNIFGSKDWAYYLLSQIFVVIAFYYVFKFSNEVLGNIKLSLISVLILESIYFYNFTSPEFNVNICQLPFWSLVVYYFWKIYNSKEIRFIDCFLVGLFAAIGFLSKYLFVYLLVSINLLFIYLIFIKKTKKFDFKYLITLEVFLVLLVPHLIWLFNNEFITVSYGLKRTGVDETGFLGHIQFPFLFLSKQIVILIPFFVLIGLLIKKMLSAINIKIEKTYLTYTINFRPPEDRKPTSQEIKRYSIFLKEHISIIDPKIIILMGSTAMEAVTGLNTKISLERGKWKEIIIKNKTFPLIITLSPSFLIRFPENKKFSWEDLKKIKQKIQNLHIDI